LVLSGRGVKEGAGGCRAIAGGDRVIVPAFWRHEMLNALLVDFGDSKM
jgi:hypothetical protein